MTNEQLKKCAPCTGLWDTIETGCFCRYGGNPETCEGPKESTRHHQERVIKPQYKLINDHFQNYKSYGIPKAQLVIADIPFNLGKNAYGSNPSWYIDGDNKNGESELAGKSFFDTDLDFRPAEFMHFGSTMLKTEKKIKFDIQCTRSDHGEVHPGINVTNYERLEHFNSDDFIGVVCDESSILKNYDGQRNK